MLVEVLLPVGVTGERLQDEPVLRAVYAGNARRVVPGLSPSPEGAS